MAKELLVTLLVVITAQAYVHAEDFAVVGYVPLPLPPPKKTTTKRHVHTLSISPTEHFLHFIILHVRRPTQVLAGMAVFTVDGRGKDVALGCVERTFDPLDHLLHRGGPNRHLSSNG